MSFSNRLVGSLDNILKALMGIGLVLVTIGFVLFFTRAAYDILPSWEMQLAVAGVIVLAMSYLSYKIFGDS